MWYFFISYLCVGQPTQGSPKTSSHRPVLPHQARGAAGPTRLRSSGDGRPSWSAGCAIRVGVGASASGAGR